MLRFKKENGSSYPEWIYTQLQDCIIESNEKATINNEYPILTSSKNGIKLQSKYFKKQIASQNTKGYKIIPNGYITYRSMSDTGDFTFNIQHEVNKGLISPAYPVFNVLDNINNNYLILFMNNTAYFKKQILYLKEGGTRYALGFAKLQKLIIQLPCLEEQTKIANFLSNVDTLIEDTEKELESLKEEEKGVMQRILSQELRFTKEDGSKYSNWHNEVLEQLCTIQIGKKDANAMATNGKYKFFTCSKKTFNIDEYSFEGKAILIAGNGDLGHTKYYEGKFDAYQRTYVLMDFICNPLFLKYWIDYMLPKTINKEQLGGAMPYIKLSTLTSLQLELPCLEEQQKIVDHLSAYDDLIETTQKELDKLKEIKNGLMQQIFM